MAGARCGRHRGPDTDDLIAERHTTRSQPRFRSHLAPPRAAAHGARGELSLSAGFDRTCHCAVELAPVASRAERSAALKSRGGAQHARSSCAPREWRYAYLRCGRIARAHAPGTAARGRWHRFFLPAAHRLALPEPARARNARSPSCARALATCTRRMMGSRAVRDLAKSKSRWGDRADAWLAPSC